MLICERQPGPGEDTTQGHFDSDDAFLIERCLEGDDRAWESVVRQYIRRILHISYRYTCSKEEAEDLMQEVFIRLYRNLHSYKIESGSFHTWVFTVARNLIIDHYRQNRHFQNMLGSEEMETLHLEEDRLLDPQQMVEQEEASRLVRDGLHDLSPHLREAVTLRDIEGMPYQDIASRLRLSEGTVKSRVKRGRTQLARILHRRGLRGRLPVPPLEPELLPLAAQP